MKSSHYACAALLAVMAGAAWGEAPLAVYGRAGMPVGSDRHAYIADTARPPSFDAQLQPPAGPGRAGGPAIHALANARAARTGVAIGDDGLRTLAYGRAGYVPEFLAAPAPAARMRHVVGVGDGASADARGKP